jgi:hypothetical protein
MFQVLRKVDYDSLIDKELASWLDDQFQTKIAEQQQEQGNDKIEGLKFLDVLRCLTLGLFSSKNFLLDKFGYPKSQNVGGMRFGGEKNRLLKKQVITQSIQRVSIHKRLVGYKLKISH